MLFDELVKFVVDVCLRLNLEVELERYFPNVFHLVPRAANLVKEIKEFGKLDCFWLVYKSPRSKKPEKFMLAVGRQRGNLLAQAHLGAGASTEQGYKVLKQVARDLKKHTKAGLWAMSGTGEIAFVKQVRISEGATIAARAGKVVLANITFGPSFFVDPPVGEHS